jgi:hypothetical protein
MRMPFWIVLELMLIGLLLQVSACTTLPDGPLLVVAPPPVPPLPAAARQPPAQGICSPTCSAAWTRLAEQWRKRLTDEE